MVFSQASIPKKFERNNNELHWQYAIIGAIIKIFD